jgi:hypothetical protein
MPPIANLTRRIVCLPRPGDDSMAIILATHSIQYYLMECHRPGIIFPSICVCYLVYYIHNANSICVTLVIGDLTCCRHLPNRWRRIYLSAAHYIIRCLNYCSVLDTAHSLKCLYLTCSHLIQYSLRFGYIRCRCCCFAIMVFYKFEIYCPIFTLSSTRPSALWTVTS